MRTMAVALLMVVLVLPWAVSAQGGMMNAPWHFQGPGMMHAVEERAVGNQTHEEMEDLMEKMMAGTLNETEQDRLVSFMNQNPGPYGMMMSRMMGGWALQGGSEYCPQSWMMGYGPGMTGGWTTGLWIFMAFVCIILLVWLVIGILVILYLVKALSKM